MFRNTSLIVCLSFAAIGIGCSSAPTAPAAPPDTRAADVQAVKDVETEWAKVALSKDIDKYANYYADNASGLFPGRPPWKGRRRSKRA